MSLSSIFMFVMPFFCVWCFYAGFKLGKAEKMPVPKVETPSKMVRSYKRSKEREKEIRRNNTLLKNIEVYKGDGEGQTKL